MVARREVSQRVQRLAREGEERLAERLALRRVRVDQRGDVLGVGLPADGELTLGDQLADAVAEQVDAEDGSVLQRARP